MPNLEAFEQNLEGGKEVSHENAWEKGGPGGADWQGRGGCVLS